MKSINLLALIFAYKTFIVIASSDDAGMQLDPSSTSTAVYYTTSSVAEIDTNISEQRFDIDMTDGNTTSTTSTKTTTKQDTKKCNNDGTCSLFENASNCPSDCNDLELSTSPPPNQDSTTNDSSVGLMFTIKSTSRNIVVTSMDIYTQISSVQTNQVVEIYTKPASYTGYETFNERDWELVYNNTNVANVNLPGEEDVSPIALSGLVIPVANGTEQSFYIHTPNLVRSTNGRRDEEEVEEDKVVQTSNDMLEIYEGIGLKQKYINVYDEDVVSSRAFVGTIRYGVGIVPDANNGLGEGIIEERVEWPWWLTTSPTMNPTTSNRQIPWFTAPPTPFPTDKPSNSPTNNPTKRPSNTPTKRPTNAPSTANPTANVSILAFLLDDTYDDCYVDGYVCFNTGQGDASCCSKFCGSNGRCSSSSVTTTPTPTKRPTKKPSNGEVSSHCSLDGYVCFNTGKFDTSCCSKQCGSNGRCTSSDDATTTKRPSSTPTRLPSKKPTPQPIPLQSGAAGVSSTSNCRLGGHVCFNDGEFDASCCSEQCGSNGRCTSSSPTKRPTKPPSANPIMLTANPTTQPTTANPTPSPTNAPVPRIVKKVSFIAMGDVPYTKDSRYCLNKQLRDLNQERMDFKFVVHVGDLKYGKVPCYESSFSDVAEIFSHPSNTLGWDKRDFFIVPGDNEFQDCQNMVDAWRWWMKYFGNGKISQAGVTQNSNGFGTMSDPNINVEYQQQPLDNNGFYPTSAANFVFFTENVLFVGIHQVDQYVGDESTRVHNNFNWVKSQMAKYKPLGMRAMVIFAHANMRNDRSTYFGYPFMDLMRNTYPDIMALYVHGSGHSFRTYYNNNNIPNLISLQVDAGDDADPLQISVTHDNQTDEYSFEIDVRRGYYYNGCQTGNMDKTWSSSY